MIYHFRYRFSFSIHGLVDIGYIFRESNKTAQNWNTTEVPSGGITEGYHYK